MMPSGNLTRFAWLSIGAAVATIALKMAAQNVIVLTHLEPVDDPAAWKDIVLDRTDQPMDAKNE
ncbi:MAG TPA: hypothetical protein VF130_04680 [Candidatus Binatia bacterium]